jgi:hypothetical protein
LRVRFGDAGNDDFARLKLVHNVMHMIVGEPCYPNP